MLLLLKFNHSINSVVTHYLMDLNNYIFESYFHNRHFSICSKLFQLIKSIITFLVIHEYFKVGAYKIFPVELRCFLLVNGSVLTFLVVISLGESWS